MRGKHESTTMTSTGTLQSEVASAEMLCYGVFRKLEPDGGGDGDGDGGEHITAGRPPPPISSVSPRVSACVYATAAADHDHDDDNDDNDDNDNDRDHDDCDYVCCNFDRGTYSVYVCDTATAITTSSTVTADVVSAGGRDDSGLSDFGGAVVWDDYDYCCGAATAVGTTVDLRGGSAPAPFSHTPMGSTTKLVGIDANSDDTPKVR